MAPHKRTPQDIRLNETSQIKRMNTMGSTCLRSLEQSDSQSQKEEWQVSGLVSGGTANECLTGTECQFGMRQGIWKWMMAKVAH
jgi:hypothetical protein